MLIELVTQPIGHVCFSVDNKISLNYSLEEEMAFNGR